MSTPKLHIVRLDYRRKMFFAELDYGPLYDAAVRELKLAADYDRVLDVEGHFYFETLPDDSTTIVLDGSAFVVHPENSKNAISFEALNSDSVFVDDALATYARQNQLEIATEVYAEWQEWRGTEDAALSAFKKASHE